MDGECVSHIATFSGKIECSPLYLVGLFFLLTGLELIIPELLQCAPENTKRIRYHGSKRSGKKIWHFTGGDLKCFTSSEFVCDSISRFHAIISCWRKNEMQKNSRNLYRVSENASWATQPAASHDFAGSAETIFTNVLHDAPLPCSGTHTNLASISLFFPHSSRARVTQRPISSNGVYCVCLAVCSLELCAETIQCHVWLSVSHRVPHNARLLHRIAYTHTYTHSEHESFCCRLSVCWRCLFLNVVVPSFVYIFMNEKHSVVINIK